MSEVQINLGTTSVICTSSYLITLVHAETNDHIVQTYMFYNKPTYLLVWSRDKSASLSRAGKMDELTTTTSRKSQKLKTRTIVIATRLKFLSEQKN